MIPLTNPWGNNEPLFGTTPRSLTPAVCPVGCSSRQLSGRNLGEKEKTIAEGIWEVIYPNCLPSAGFSLAISLTSDHPASLRLHPVVPIQPVITSNKLHSCQEPNPVTMALTDQVLASVSTHSGPRPSLQGNPYAWKPPLYFLSQVKHPWQL